MTNGFAQAVGAVSYPMSFRRVRPRTFTQDMLFGPSLPNARGDGSSDGGWTSGDAPDDGADVEVWLAHFAEMVVSEAVHEALEWLRVDGALWLDPHGPAEYLIHSAVHDLCVRLAALHKRCQDEPDADRLDERPLRHPAPGAGT